MADTVGGLIRVRLIDVHGCESILLVAAGGRHEFKIPVALSVPVPFSELRPPRLRS